MAVTDPRQRQRASAPLLTARQVRDLTAVALTTIGTGSFLAVIFLINILAGFAVASAVVAAIGVYLGIER